MFNHKLADSSYSEQEASPMWETVLSCLPHWFDNITKDEKKMRKKVTQRYANMTLVGSILLILLIPVWRRLAQRLHLRMEIKTNIICIITLWTAIAVGATTLQSRNDLLVIAKRLGRIPVALMPALLLLTSRPSPLPTVLYLTLLPIHKWLSRIVVLQGLLHTILYLFYFNHKGTMSKVLKLENIYGIIAMVAFILIAITSLPRIRRIAFKVFYFTHYLMTWVSVLALYFHARPGIPVFTSINILILVSQIAYRVHYTTLTKLTVTPMSPTLALVEFPINSIARSMELPVGHVRINNKHRGLKALWYHLVPFQHPFTVSSLPTDETVKLIVRRGTFPLISNHHYYITGAFEPELAFIHSKAKKNGSVRQPLLGGQFGGPMDYNITAERVLIIVGGSGISFGLPLYRLLNYNGISVRLIWVCKDIRDLNILNWFRGIQGIECYITGENDIEVDYYDDQKHGLDAPTIEYYGSLDDDASEIDFTTLGREYKEAHNIGPSSPLSLSSPYTALTPMPSLSPLKRVPKYHSAPVKKIPSFKRLAQAKSVPALHPDGLLDKPSTKSLNFHENIHIATSGQCSFTTTPPHLAHLPRSELPEFEKLKLPASVRVFSGRPNLGAEDYDWCTQTSCIGPRIEHGKSVCCRDVQDDGAHKRVNKENVWVIGAGPQGLVDEAGDWAKEGGLKWHGESFSV